MVSTGAVPSNVRPSVSVVISAKNAAGRVGASLRSAVAALAPNDEIIAIDDGSTDDSFAEMKRALAGVPHRLLRTEGIGLTRALQLGVEAAKGAFIARLDAGDAMTPDRLRVQQAAFARDPSLVLCGGNVRYVDPSGRALGQSHVLLHDRSLRALLLVARNPFFHCTWMVRREPFVGAGGYRSFFRFCQDYDAALRLSACGTLCNVPDVIGDALVSTDGISVLNNGEQIRLLRIARADFVARALGVDKPLAARDRPMPAIHSWSINYARALHHRAMHAHGRGQRLASLVLRALAYLPYPEIAAVTIAANVAERVIARRPSS
jgi:glycosyltransferase involved in cell wall biosynthesis